MFDYLVELRARSAERHMLDLFAEDPDRAATFCAATGDMRLDYSKTQITARIRDELGWRPSVTLEQGLERTVQWYLDNEAWWRALQTREGVGQRLGKAG